MAIILWKRSRIKIFGLVNVPVIYYNNVIYLYKTTKDFEAEKRIIGIITKQGGSTTYQSKVSITKDGKSAEATKLMALMGLGVKCGENVEVSVEGADEDTAFEGIKAFFEANL